MSGLGKRQYGGSGSGSYKKQRSSGGAMARKTMAYAASSGRYNRSMSARRSNLQRAIGVSGETGFVDVASAAYALDTTGSVTLLNTVAQGASVNQRVGKKIALRGLQCRGAMLNNASAILNDVAFMIVYDKRPTGALPAVTDILAFATASAMNNDANSGRFSIVKRVDADLAGNTTAAANLTDKTICGTDWWVDLKGRPTVYKAAGTGAIGDIEEGALYLVTVGGNAAGVTAAALSATFRLRFKDM